MKHSPKVSIMIPSFNRVHLLPRAIRSCQLQTHKNVEVVIYDDGSTDNTESVVRAIAVKDRRVHYHRGRCNAGEIPSRTRLMGLATGEYGCWLDSDDLCNRWRIELQLWAFGVMKDINPSFIRTAHARMCDANADSWERKPIPAWKYDRVTATAMFRMDVARKTAYDHSVINGGDIVHELQMTLDSGPGIVFPFECYLQDSRPVDRMKKVLDARGARFRRRMRVDLGAHTAPLLKQLAVRKINPCPPVVPNRIARAAMNRLHGTGIALF